GIVRQIVRVLLAAAAPVLVTAGTTTVSAQETPVEQLQFKLRERDKVIGELLERVKALERRVGVPSRRTESPPKVETKRAEKNDAAPGTVVVSESEAERALERSLTREGAFLLSAGFLEIEPSFTYVRSENATSSFVSSGGGVLAAQTEQNADSFTGDLALRLGLPWDSQFEVGLPYRLRRSESVTSVGFTPVSASSDWGAGLGDVRLGLAKTLLRESLWRPDLVGRLTWNTDSGAVSDNGVSLGGGFHELTASLTAIKRQDPIAFIGGLSYGHSLEMNGVQPGSTVSANAGAFIALSPESSLRLVLSGSYQDETETAGIGLAGSSRTIGTLVLGGSTLLAPGILLNLSAGIGLTNDADDFSFSLSMPIRFNTPLF
ncbi:MAG: hypothetical protein OEY85_08745, partial [Rhodospirillales bacterium]|nr:hypothetical protein [Rhodospirillales bacterium]